MANYQYGTSPRKIEPEYKKKPQKKKPVSKKNVKSKPKNKTKKKYKMSFEIKFFLNSMAAFIIIFAMIACQALVEQKYKEKETLKKQYNELIASTNSSGDLSDDVRTVATEYGMQTKSATLINLETSDYIESSANQVKMEEENIFTKIINWIKDKI